MNKFNYTMFQYCLKQLRNDNSLADSLFQLILKGFIRVDKCYFLRHFKDKQEHINPSDFLDKTGHECFINSFHIDDYINSDFFIQSLLFTEQLFKEWKKRKNKLTLKVILSETQYGINIKFHVVRTNENWINEDELDKFKEAIMICSSR